MARTCILRADVVLSSSDVTFVLFCFVFVSFIFAFTEAAALRSIVIRSSIYMRPRQQHAVTTVCVLFRFYFFLSSFFRWRSLFFRVFLNHYHRFSLRMESTSYVSSFRMVFFYLVITGWIFDISLSCENSINQSINQSINHDVISFAVAHILTLQDRHENTTVVPTELNKRKP